MMRRYMIKTMLIGPTFSAYKLLSSVWTRAFTHTLVIIMRQSQCAVSAALRFKMCPESFQRHEFCGGRRGGPSGHAYS